MRHDHLPQGFVSYSWTRSPACVSLDTNEHSRPSWACQNTGGRTSLAEGDDAGVLLSTPKLPAARIPEWQEHLSLHSRRRSHVADRRHRLRRLRRSTVR
eukprot:COSAG01_NODE_35338_length_533_cov_1.154378_2_plen_99_part_00